MLPRANTFFLAEGTCLEADDPLSHVVILHREKVLTHLRQCILKHLKKLLRVFLPSFPLQLTKVFASSENL